MRVQTAVALTLASLVILPPALAAMGGDVDPAFSYPNPAQAIPDSTNAVEMPDGGLVVVTSRTDPSPATTSTVDLARIDANGDPVAAFGAQDGRLRVNLPLRLNVSRAAFRDAAGNILLGGHEVSGDPAGARKAALVRLDAQGEIDLGFGDRGVVLLDAPAGRDDRFEQVAVLPDGRIVAGVSVTLDRLVPDWNCETGPDLASLLIFGSTGHSPAVLTELDNTLTAISTCANPLTLRVQPDGEILFGNQVGAKALVPPDYNTMISLPAPGAQASWGPFRAGMIAAFINDDSMRLYADDRNEPNRGLWIPPRSEVDPPWLPLLYLAGFGNSSLLVQTLVGSSFGSYAGFSDGVNGGVVALDSGGAVRTDWGGGDGVIAVPAAWVSGGAGDIRQLFAQPNGDVIVVTSNGLVRRLLAPAGVAHGGFALAGQAFSVAESDFIHTLRVSRTGGSVGAVSVKYLVSPDCDPAAGPGCFTPGSYAAAASGEDFESASGELFWDDGDTEEKTVQVTVKDDQVPELVEYFFVQLSQPLGGAVILAGTTAFAINTNDQAPPPRAPPDTGPASTGGGGAMNGWLLALVALLFFQSAKRYRRQAAFSMAVVPCSSLRYAPFRLSRPTCDWRLVPALMLMPGLLLAAPGEPDPTFVYPAPLAPVPDSTNLVRLTNGYMVVTSRLERDPDADATLELTRIDLDGARIDSFGVNGHVTTLLPGPLNVATATASMADGSLLLAGFKRVGSSDDSVAAILRLTPDGALDPTFGASGVVTFDVPGQLDRVAEIQHLYDGRIALVTWSRLAAPAVGCWSDRTSLWYLNGQGGERTEVSVIERAPVATTACRTAVNLRADWDDQDFYRVLWGNEAGMHDGAEPYVTGSSGPYGPFDFFWYYPTYFSLVRGDAFELRGGSTPSAPGTHVHATLAAAAGFSEPITWTRLLLAHGSLYAGFSTAGGQVAVARMAVDGYLDKSWGVGNGVGVVTGAGRAGVTAPGGLAKDIRYLGLTDAGVVVATADGVIQRLQSGTKELGGIIALKAGHASYFRSLGTIPVRVERTGNTQGAVSVQYEVVTSGCGPPVTCRDDYTPAQPDQDFAAQRGQVSWADGEGGEKTITVTLPDQAFAQPYETFAVRIFQPTGVTRIATDTVVLLLEPTGEGPSSGSGNPSGGGGGGGDTGWATLLLLSGLAARYRRGRPAAL